jgi:hypothetical protein
LPSSNLNVKVQSLLFALEDKMQFRDVTDVLKEKKLPSAIGWKQLIAKIDGGTAEVVAAYANTLAKIYGDLVLSGTKEVHVFSLDEFEARQIASAFAQIKAVSGPYTASYPLPVSPTELAKQSRELKLTSKVTHPNGDVSLIFCSVRSEMDKTEYRMNEVADAVKQAFAGYDSFFAMRRREFQIFDVLTIRPSLRRMEVLIDHPDRMRDKETGEDRCLALLAAVSGESPKLKQLYETNTPENLFPCISALYQKFGEGLVRSLSFRALSKSLKKESVVSKDDLRKEPFHEAGIRAVGTITVYDITVVWEKFFGVEGSAAVRIHIPIGGLSTTGSYVRSAKIVEAKNDGAVVAVINKLVSYST